MKAQAMRLVLAVLVLAVVGSSGQAAVRDRSGTWSGSGTYYDASANPAGSFQIRVENQAVSEGELDSHVEVTLPDGKTESYDQVMRKTSDHHFTLVTSQGGHGGGACFEDLCESYLHGTEGSDFAITIVLDGPDQMRILMTTLKDGKPTAFSREKLTRVN